ncbi:hypothetical protein BMIN_0879 [Bifidobacterium minimum]|uniref:Uncharacterized protein n=1 Tax=Bifidobacterium minimum TaxID=1693 RepID=A0A087BS87_9BIFI|nr:hypothetical protein BMIN_0879 [Bifidobacterium minimum]
MRKNPGTTSGPGKTREKNGPIPIPRVICAILEAHATDGGSATATAFVPTVDGCAGLNGCACLDGGVTPEGGVVVIDRGHAILRIPSPVRWRRIRQPSTQTFTHNQCDTT